MVIVVHIYALWYMYEFDVINTSTYRKISPRDKGAGEKGWSYPGDPSTADRTVTKTGPRTSIFFFLSVMNRMA